MTDYYRGRWQVLHRGPGEEVDACRVRLGRWVWMATVAYHHPEAAGQVAYAIRTRTGRTRRGCRRAALAALPEMRAEALRRSIELS